MSAFITTVTKRRIDVETMLPSDVDITDIACGLSNVCRYAGQIAEFYCVAQHALAVAAVSTPRLKFAALHHDDSEAYIGDVSRNFKHSPYMQGYVIIESRIQMAVEQALDIPRLSAADHQEIKAADDLMAIFEQVTIREQRHWDMDEIARAVDQNFVQSSRYDLEALNAWLPGQRFAQNIIFLPYDNQTARYAFLREHHRLLHQRSK